MFSNSPFHIKLINTKLLIILAINLLLICLALMVIYNVHYARQLNIKLEYLNLSQQNQAIEYSKLLLEKSTLLSSQRVERIASEQLDLVPINPNLTIMLGVVDAN